MIDPLIQPLFLKADLLSQWLVFSKYGTKVIMMLI